MLTLLTHNGGSGFYSYSMFCTKAAYFLEMAGERWQREDFRDLAAMPHGKLPVLRDGEALIPDSEGIRSFLEARGADFDPDLTPDQKAVSRIIIRMVDESLWAQLICARWLEDAGWSMMLKTLFEGAPVPLANQIRETVLAGVHFTGHARFSKEERLARLEQDLSALAGFLGDEPFLFGTQVTAADCSAAPMIEALSRAPADPEVTARVENYGTLMAYVRRVKDRFDL